MYHWWSDPAYLYSYGVIKRTLDRNAVFVNNCNSINIRVTL